MQPQAQPPENSDEISQFITEGAHRLAAISLNDYGFLLSARMAQTYLVRALRVLDTKRGFDRAFFNEVKLLKAAGQSITVEYAQLETFCTDCERFDHQETKNWIEWISKWAVGTRARAYRATVSHLLAYKIRTFHSRVCSILVEN